VPEEILEGPQGPGPAEQQPANAPVLVVFAHPDDAEIAAGRTMARWTSEGRAVHLLILTNGDRGSEDPKQDRGELAETRREESEVAGRLMGLATVRVLAMHDGELENTPEVRSEIVRRIREVRPGIVLSCDPTAWFFGNRYFNHADHRTAGAVALDAVFPAAGNPLFFAEQLDEGLEAWKVSEVWLGWTNEPNHFQDVSGFMDRKVAALGLHASQVQGNMLGFFEEWLPAEAEENGRKIGVQHAEGFRVLALE
jgi:LmbE family N-acetylglucosaminyl deacetylase